MSLLSTLKSFTAPRELFARSQNGALGHALVARSLDLDVLVPDPLQNGVVAACVNAVAKALPDAPLLLENRTPDGWREVPDHECLRVLRAPNADHSDADVWGLTSGYKATRGQAFWLILPDKLGRVGEIHVWNPDLVTVLGDESQFISGYRIRRENGTAFEVGRSGVIHFRHLPDFHNPRLGWNPLRTGRAQIAGDNIGASYHTSILHNAGVVSLLISLKEGAATGQVTPEQFQQVLTNIRRASRERSGGVEGINLPLEVHKLAYSPDEMNVDKLIQYYETRICSVMGVSQRVAGLGSDPTYNNLSEALSDFWERRIVPDRNADAATLNRQWLPLFGLDDGNWRFRFDYSGVPALQENRDALHARVRADFEKGLLDKKQARALLGYGTSSDEAFAGVFYGDKPAMQTQGDLEAAVKTSSASGWDNGELSDSEIAEVKGLLWRLWDEGDLSEPETVEVKGLLSRLWQESEHPRDEDGKFTDKGGSLAKGATSHSVAISRSIDSHFDGDRGKSGALWRDRVDMFLGHLVRKKKNAHGVSPKRMSDATLPVEKHLLSLLDNGYLHDDADLGRYASTISHVAHLIPEHLHGIIVEKVKTIDLFSNTKDLNRVGLSKYGLSWGDRCLACVMGGRHLMLDGAGWIEENAEARRKYGYKEADFERERRNTYTHELCHITDFYGWEKRANKKEISQQEDWKLAFETDLKGRGPEAGFSDDARQDPAEAFAEMMTFLIAPETMKLGGFTPSLKVNLIQQAHEHCQASYPFMYDTLKSYEVIKERSL